MTRGSIFVLLFVAHGCFGQFSTVQQKQFDFLRTFQLDNYIDESDNQELISKYFTWQYNYLANGTIKPYNATSANSDFEKSITHLWNGDLALLNRVDKNADSTAYAHYLQALNLSEKGGWNQLSCESYKRLLRYHIKNQQDFDTFQKLAGEYQKLAYDDFEKTYAIYFLVAAEMGRHYFLNEPQDNIPEKLNNGITKAKATKNKFLEARLTQLLGVHYDLQEEPELPLKLYTEAAKIYKAIPFEFSQQHGQDLTFNIASYYIDRNDVANARKYMALVKPEHFKKKDAVDQKLILRVYYQIHKQSNNSDSALFYLEKRKQLEDSLGLVERTNTINEFEAKYKASEKEKENILLQADNDIRKRQQRTTLIITISIITIGFLIGFLLFKNTKRKQRIAEQQRELEIQKTEKILKEQELTTIDAMIQGQEKERQRLASDLHDSVGATLAAAKLQFEHLSKNREKGAITEELFDKTGKLLEDAYTEIRTMAHVKNSGVIAKNGLLPAVQKLARNASGVNGLTIEVEDYGLEERLDNLLEIAVFRVIQELVTNIIKHANATEASIAINQYKDSLSIIIEDNGKGFDARHLPQKEGMGLSSIEKRIEHIEGSMEIDSTPGKGTHILIDIPL